MVWNRNKANYKPNHQCHRMQSMRTTTTTNARTVVAHSFVCKKTTIESVTPNDDTWEIHCSDVENSGVK